MDKVNIEPEDFDDYKTKKCGGRFVTQEYKRHLLNFEFRLGNRKSAHILLHDERYEKSIFHFFSPSKPHQESFGKRCTYKVPKTSTNVKLVTTIDRNGAETKRVQCEYCPKTHINVPVYNLHVNTGLCDFFSFS